MLLQPGPKTTARSAPSAAPRSCWTCSPACQSKDPGEAQQRYRLQRLLAQGCPSRCPGLRHLPGSAGGVCRGRRSGGGVPRPDRAAARLLHRRQRVHLHHRKSLGLRCPAARFSRRSPRKRPGQARPALTPAPIIPVPESAVNPAPAGSSSLAILAVRYKIVRLWRSFVLLLSV